MRVIYGVYKLVTGAFNWFCDTDLISERTKGIIVGAVLLYLCLTDQP